LERRFPFKFKIEDYTPEELQKIFIKIVYENGWTFIDEYKPEITFFITNKDYFKFFGGDLLLFFYLL